MTPAGRLALAAEARANVTRVIGLLQWPTAAALDRSAGELVAAIAGMQELHVEFARNPAACASKGIIAALRKDLQRAGMLLRHAWELRAGLGGPLGYTRKGEWVPQAQRQTRWALEA